MPADPPLKNAEARQAAHTGVLLVNLGTPAAPTTRQVRRYLREFLSDQRVVELPKWLWWPILNLFVLPLRASKSAKAYQGIWTDEGSPLLTHSLALTNALSDELSDCTVELGMRYGQPAMSSALQKLQAQGITRLLVLPLYPQYSGSTQGAVFDALSRSLQRWRRVPELRFVADYHDHPAYIEALATHIRTHRQAREVTQASSSTRPASKLVLSYHGLPERFVSAGDPYYQQCLNTSRLLAAALGEDADTIVTCFQSRFGKAQWLKPYTDQTLISLAEQGHSSIELFCPGFAVDCLETLEEIAVENRDYYLQAGGEVFSYIPALNAESAHVSALKQILNEHAAHWLS